MIRPVRFSQYRFDSDSVVYGLAKSLFTAQAPLRRLHGYMPKQELNLFQFTACRMAEPRARSAEVVGREFRHLQFPGVQLNHVPHHFLRHPVAPNRS
jgi:hypothetical protein